MGVDDADVAAALRGPVRVLAESSVGRFSLHASGIELDGRVVAFTGPSGAGKSTLAGAVSSLGYDVVADDTIPLVGHMATTVDPALRLFEDSLTALGLHPGEMQSVVSWGTKKRTGDSERIVDLVEPSLVYQLRPRSDLPAPTFEALSGVEAAIVLVSNLAWHSSLTLEQQALALGDATNLLSRCHVRRATYERSFASLADLAEAFVSDAATVLNDGSPR